MDDRIEFEEDSGAFHYFQLLVGFLLALGIILMLIEPDLADNSRISQTNWTAISVMLLVLFELFE